MINKNICVSLFMDMNFIIIMFLYLINKGKIKLINNLYYINYEEKSNNNIDLNKVNKNYFINFDYNQEIISTDKIKKNDKMFLLSHITVLRNISREKNNNMYFIIDNCCISLKSNFKKKDIKNIRNHLSKYFPIVQVISSTKNSNSLCYVINRLSAKILVIIYIFMINRAYNK